MDDLILAEAGKLDIPAIISRWLHLIAVITAVGGTIFIRLALFPTVKVSLTDEQRQTLHPKLMSAWGRIVHVAILVIILSGFYNFMVIMKADAMPKPYHAIFGVKIILAIVLFFYAVALTGRSNATAGLRKNSPKWMMVNIMLAAIIVLLSNILKFTSSSLGG